MSKFFAGIFMTTTVIMTALSFGFLYEWQEDRDKLQKARRYIRNIRTEDPEIKRYRKQTLIETRPDIELPNL